jgi:uncharacterized protein YaiI (UPF0178 family)
MKLLVDADACPRSVLQLCLELGRENGIPVWTVASFDHRIDSDHHIIVGNDPQEADIEIINLAEEGDIVVTQDWGLAAVVLGKGAWGISPGGREYRPDQMAFMLEERDMKARFRRSGGRTKGPKKRTGGDDRKFKTSLRRLLSQAANKPVSST